MSNDMVDGQVIEGAPTVFEAVNEVMRDVQSIAKDGFNKGQNFSFRGIDAVMNAVGPSLRKRGVIAVPMVEDMQRSSYTTGRGTVMQQVMLQMRVRWYGPGGDFFDSVTWGEASDAADKATAKAHSVAFRTAMLETLCLPTDDPDPDEAYEPRETVAERREREQFERSQYVKAQTEGMLQAEKDGDMDRMIKAREHYSAQQDAQLVQMCTQIIERMQVASAPQSVVEGEQAGHGPKMSRR